MSGLGLDAERGSRTRRQPHCLWSKKGAPTGNDRPLRPSHVGAVSEIPHAVATAWRAAQRLATSLQSLGLDGICRLAPAEAAAAIPVPPSGSDIAIRPRARDLSLALPRRFRLWWPRAQIRPRAVASTAARSATLPHSPDTRWRHSPSTDGRSYERPVAPDEGSRGEARCITALSRRSLTPDPCPAIVPQGERGAPPV